MPQPVNYFANDEWHGYIYSVADDTSRIERDNRCASGVVTANADFQSFALWGWNIQQAEGSDVVASWEPSADAVRYMIGGNLDDQALLHLSIKNELGQKWCHVILTNELGEAQLADFNSACWDGSGTAYDGSSIVSIEVIVPSSNTIDQPFHFCVDQLQPSRNAQPPAVDYREANDWHGYLFSAADATSEIERHAECAYGVVTRDIDFQSFALWGWNINQAEGSDVVGAWEPNADTVHYDIFSFTEVGLRLVVRDELGHEWCYVLPDDFGDASLADFSSACWDNSGTTYDGSPIVAVHVFVPGSDTIDQPFHFCVDELEPRSAAE